METPRSIEERREEVINGPFGHNLRQLGFIYFYQDEVHPDIDDPDVVYFDLTRKAEDLSRSMVNKIERDVCVLAQSLGLTVKSVNKSIGKKGDFYNGQTQIQICVEV